VTALLSSNQSQLHSLAKALIEYETLTQKDIREVLDGTFVCPRGPPGTPPPSSDAMKSDKSKADSLIEHGVEEPLPEPATAAATRGSQ
jgi:hypothetical protein